MLFEWLAKAVRKRLLELEAENLELVRWTASRPGALQWTLQDGTWKLVTGSSSVSKQTMLDFGPRSMWPLKHWTE